MNPAASAPDPRAPRALAAGWRVVEGFLERGEIPGAVAAVAGAAGPPVLRAGGMAERAPRPRPMREDTLFDLASLTKVVATLPAVLRLAERGVLDLDEPVARRFPEFRGEGKERVTLRHLLTHTSGLPAWRDFTAEPRPERVAAEPLEAEPGSRCVYSDLGFILLGAVVERAAGLALDRVCARDVFAPLGMADTGFRPGPERRARCAATEPDPATGRPWVGVVHDENARAFGGVSGHAGLFGSAADLARYGQAWLGALAGRPQDLLAPATARAAVAEHGATGRALGWQLARPGTSAGTLLCPSAFGHTGFTGTSLWIDPERQLVCVLLTNRVHLGRERTAEAIARLRIGFHDAVAAAWDRAEG